MMTREDERRLLRRLRQRVVGSEESTPTLEQDQNRLFDHCRGPALAVCRRILGHSASAEEVVQEALVKAWEKIPEFQGRSRFSTFVVGIAFRLAYARVRKKDEVLTSDGLLEAQSDEMNVVSQLAREERRKLVQATLHDLEPLEQEVAYLRYAEELPYATIERLLEIDTEMRKSGVRGILKTLKARLRMRLRSHLQELGVGTSFLRSMP